MEAYESSQPLDSTGIVDSKSSHRSKVLLEGNTNKGSSRYSRDVRSFRERSNPRSHREKHTQQPSDRKRHHKNEILEPYYYEDEAPTRRHYAAVNVRAEYDSDSELSRSRKAKHGKQHKRKRMRHSAVGSDERGELKYESSAEKRESSQLSMSSSKICGEDAVVELKRKKDHRGQRETFYKGGSIDSKTLLPETLSYMKEPRDTKLEEGHPKRPYDGSRERGFVVDSSGWHGGANDGDRSDRVEGVNLSLPEDVGGDKNHSDYEEHYHDGSEWKSDRAAKGKYTKYSSKRDKKPMVEEPSENYRRDSGKKWWEMKPPRIRGKGRDELEAAAPGGLSNRYMPRGRGRAMHMNRPFHSTADEVVEHEEYPTHAMLKPRLPHHGGRNAHLLKEATESFDEENGPMPLFHGESGNMYDRTSEGGYPLTPEASLQPMGGSALTSTALIDPKRSMGLGSYGESMPTAHLRPRGMPPPNWRPAFGYSHLEYTNTAASHQPPNRQFFNPSIADAQRTSMAPLAGGMKRHLVLRPGPNASLAKRPPHSIHSHTNLPVEDLHVQPQGSSQEPPADVHPPGTSPHTAAVLLSPAQRTVKETEYSVHREPKVEGSSQASTGCSHTVVLLSPRVSDVVPLHSPHSRPREAPSTASITGSSTVRDASRDSYSSRRSLSPTGSSMRPHAYPVPPHPAHLENNGEEGNGLFHRNVHAEKLPHPIHPSSMPGANMGHSNAPFHHPGDFYAQGGHTDWEPSTPMMNVRGGVRPYRPAPALDKERQMAPSTRHPNGEHDDEGPHGYSMHSNGPSYLPSGPHTSASFHPGGGVVLPRGRPPRAFLPEQSNSSEYYDMYNSGVSFKLGGEGEGGPSAPHPHAALHPPLRPYPEGFWQGRAHPEYVMNAGVLPTDGSRHGGPNGMFEQPSTLHHQGPPPPFLPHPSMPPLRLFSRPSHVGMPHLLHNASHMLAGGMHSTHRRPPFQAGGFSEMEMSSQMNTASIGGPPNGVGPGTSNEPSFNAGGEFSPSRRYPPVAPGSMNPRLHPMLPHPSGSGRPMAASFQRPPTHGGLFPRGMPIMASVPSTDIQPVTAVSSDAEQINTWLDQEVQNVSISGTLQQLHRFMVPELAGSTLCEAVEALAGKDTAFLQKDAGGVELKDARFSDSTLDILHCVNYEESSPGLEMVCCQSVSSAAATTDAFIHWFANPTDAGSTEDGERKGEAGHFLNLLQKVQLLPDYVDRNSFLSVCLHVDKQAQSISSSSSDAQIGFKIVSGGELAEAAVVGNVECHTQASSSEDWEPFSTKLNGLHVGSLNSGSDDTASTLAKSHISVPTMALVASPNDDPMTITQVHFDGTELPAVGAKEGVQHLKHPAASVFPACCTVPSALGGFTVEPSVLC